MTTYISSHSLLQFKDDIKGRRIYLLFYSATIEPTAKVFCIEVSFEAFEILVISNKVQSFEADFGAVVTIENIKV